MHPGSATFARPLRSRAIATESRAVPQRTRFRRRRIALAARTVLLVLSSASRPASAETIIQADGAANVGYFETSEQGSSRAFTEVRPALALQVQSPRVTWRAGYVFAGSLTLGSEQSRSYSNEVDLSLAAQLTKRSAMFVTGSVAQSTTEFQLSQRAPDAGQPAFRSRENPELVTTALTESYVFEPSAQLRLGQAVTGTLIAPRNALDEFNASMTASLSLDRALRSGYGHGSRDTVGGELRSSYALLRPAAAPDEPFWNVRNALLARWSHDFSWRWNAQATAGVEQVLTLAGSYPLAIVPTASVTAQYLTRNGGGALAVTYGAATDLQTGTVSLSQGVVARAFVSFDSLRPRQIGVSAGFLHAEPLGQSAARTAAGVGNAAHGDVGLVWSLSDAVLVSARYSVAYQFDQPGALEPLLAHVVLVGVTMHYSSARSTPPMPRFGGRADGSDGVGFTEGGPGKP